MKVTNVITEIFDQHYQWKWQLQDKYEWYAVFNDIAVTFDADTDGIWEVAFSVNTKTPHDLTQTGDSFKIFSTVIAVIKDFLRKNTTADKLEFTAKNAGRNNRASLYTKMVRKFAGTSGLDVAITHDSNNTLFILTRKATEIVALTELFDYVYPWSIIKRSPFRTLFQFKSEAGNVIVNITKVGDEGEYELMFTSNGILKRTNSGDQFKIFSTVIDIVKSFVEDTPNFSSIGFVAKREGKALDSPDIKDSRLSLYTAMLDAFTSKNVGWSFIAKTIGRMVEFKLFKEMSVNETIHLPNADDTLGVERRDMPQIHKNHYKAFLKYLEANGGTHNTDVVSADTLKPTQKEFSKAGVHKMIKKKSAKPLLTSSDNYIIDGHHRWLAAVNTRADVNIIRINLPIAKLLKLTQEFPHATYKEIYEQSLIELSIKKRKRYSKRATHELNLMVGKLRHELYKVEHNIPGSLTSISFEKLAHEIEKRQKGLELVASGQLDENIVDVASKLYKLAKYGIKLARPAKKVVKAVTKNAIERKNAIKAAGDRAMNAGQHAAIKAAVNKEVRNSKILNTGQAVIKNFGANPGSADLVGGALTVAGVAAANKTANIQSKIRRTPLTSRSQKKYNDRVVPTSANSPRTLIPDPTQKK